METDNEFDKVFRSKLTGFEAEPSADAWSGIEDKLNARKRKVTTVPLLGIAASILIVLSAGLLFIPHKSKTDGRHLVKNKVSRVNQPLNVPEIEKNAERRIVKSKTGKTIPAQTIAVNKVQQPYLVKYEAVKIKDTELKQSPVIELSGHPLAGSIRQNKQELINPVVIVKEVPPIEQSLNEKINEKPVLAAAQLPVADEPVAETVKPKHKIKTFGDLVNVVVGKVDKRKDKLIEFTDVDDDESTITGINLGVLKIKKEK